VVEKNVIYQTRKTGVEDYKFENTVGQLQNFTDISAEKFSQSTLLLLYFYVNSEKSVCILVRVGDKSFPVVLYKAEQDALFGEHIRP